MATMHAVRGLAQGKRRGPAAWTGLALTGLVGPFMTFDVVEHLMRPAAVVQAFAQLAFPLSAAVPLSLIETVFVVLYLVPRTKVLGAILLTAYLGGAVALNVRIEAPLLTNVLFPVYTATLLWVSVFLRDPRLRSLLDPRSR